MVYNSFQSGFEFSKMFFKTKGAKFSHCVESAFSQYHNCVTPSHCRILFVKTFFFFFLDFQFFFVNVKNLCRGGFYFGSLSLNFFNFILFYYLYSVVVLIVKSLLISTMQLQSPDQNLLKYYHFPFIDIYVIFVMPGSFILNRNEK